LRGVKDLLILRPWLFKDVLWGDEAVGGEPPESMGDVEDVVITFLLGHGGHDWVDLDLMEALITSCRAKEQIV
jgi:hypothetical protein